jgi:AraC-like DNA-binding protein
VYPENLKVQRFQGLNKHSIICMVIALCFTCAKCWAAPADSDSAKKNEAAIDSVGPATGSPAAGEGTNTADIEDSGYTFSEEYSGDETALTDSLSTIDTLPVPPAIRKHSASGKKFLSVVAAVKVLTQKNMKFISGPLQLVTLHGRKLIIPAVLFLIIMLTISLYRERHEKGRFMTTTRLSIMDKEVQRACRFIEEHFNDTDLGTERICAELVTGGAFLEALFVKELGLTVDDFIAQVRINRAKIALRKTPAMPLESLVHLCGYTDVQQFIDRFTAITGCSLDEYRRTLVGRTDETV